MERISDKKFQVGDGKISYMSPQANPNHTKVKGNILTVFENYLSDKQCIAYTDAIEILLTKIPNLNYPKDSKIKILIPDVCVICNRSIITRKGLIGAPDLAVEILSPSTAEFDKTKKKDLYELIGTNEYWLVDIEMKSIFVYILTDRKYIMQNMHVLTDRNSQFKTSLYDDLIINLNDIFKNMIKWE